MTANLAPTSQIDTDTLHVQGEIVPSRQSRSSPLPAPEADEAFEWLKEKAQGFNPIIADHDYSDSLQNKIKNTVGFNAAPYFSYYNILRTQQYLFQAITPLGAGLIARGVLHRDEGLNSAAETMDLLFNRNKLRNQAEESRAQQGQFQMPTPLEKDADALKLFYIAEATVMTAVALGRTAIEASHMLDDFRLSLAAEFGKDREDIGIQELFDSKNPIITIERNRTLWKLASRGTSAAGFYFGLTEGLVTSALNIGAERTLFFTNTPYDILSKAVNDVQFNHLTGDGARENLIKDFQKALQNMYADRGKNTISEEDMHGLRPVLEKVAQDVIDKRIGVESIFGVMGGGIIVVGDPAQSEINYDFVSKYMMESVVELARKRRASIENDAANNIVPFDRHNIWNYKLREGGTHSISAGIATTARPDFVEAERNRIAEKDFNNLGIRARV
jgi:hypothetical protein